MSLRTSSTGKRAQPGRDRFEKEYVEFKLGALIQEARLQKGLTAGSSSLLSAVRTKLPFQRLKTTSRMSDSRLFKNH